jgi:hypothetical protein
VGAQQHRPKEIQMPWEIPADPILAQQARLQTIGIWQAQNEQPAWTQKRYNLSENLARLVNMLEHIPQRNDVKICLWELHLLQPHIKDIQTKMLAGIFSGSMRRLDPLYTPTKPPHTIEKNTSRAAHIENSAGPPGGTMHRHTYPPTSIAAFEPAQPIRLIFDRLKKRVIIWWIVSIDTVNVRARILIDMAASITGEQSKALFARKKKIWAFQ